MRKAMYVVIAALLAAGCSSNGRKPSAEEKHYPAFDVQNMDKNVKPGDDFFAYVNGTWLKNNPIPADKNSWSSFEELFEKNRHDIKSIIIEASSEKDAQPGSIPDKIGKFYNSGMDSVSIEKQGALPLKPWFDKIESIKNSDDLLSVAADLQASGLAPFFAVFSGQDMKNSQSVIANTWQAGIGLPDRDYYFNNDAATKKIREAYVVHLQKMFKLLGDGPEAAVKNAETVMKIETQFAKASNTNVENQDPQKLYNMYTIDGINKIAPDIKFKAYFTALGYPDIKEVNVNQPAFIAEVNKMVLTIPVEDWKTFLKWEVTNTAAGYLSNDFVAQNFDFYYKTLSGQEKDEPRWKKVLDATSGSLGEAIGQLYVQKFFPPEAKQKMTDLVMNLKKSLRTRIENLSWMSPETKTEAIAKLDKMGVKVGYPDKWRDYSGLEITSQSYFQNLANSMKFEFRYNMDKIGKPVDPNEWGMTPQTVNAYYNPSKNEIVFPAGILQPPFFNLYADDAINYGSIGLVIGHEMTHGFDNMGRQFDKDGNLRDWWTKEDSKSFEQHTQVLVDQYNKYEVLDSVFVNGKLTLGENIADLGGATVAYYAYLYSLQGKEAPKPIDGFTNFQRFFLGYAQIWRTNMRDEALRRKVKTNEHSPEMVRVNGVVYNMPEFYAAFPEVKPGDKLYREEKERPVIW